MTLSVKVTRKTNNLEKLKKRLKELSSQNVQSGYFRQQGDHPEAEMPFAGLMYLHEYGFNNIPPRPIREITMFKIPSELNSVFAELKKYIRGQNEVDDVLDMAGWKITGIAVSLFGKASPKIPANSPYTESVKGFNAPLVDSGLLKNAWSWKNSVDNFLKNINDGGF